MILIIILIIVLLVFLFIRFKSKKLKLPNVSLITGGVKTGKTTLAVYLAIKKWKSLHFKWKIKKFFKIDCEEPLLYSNIRLRGVPFVMLTKDLLLRKKRFNYKSVVLISEGALVADSQNYKDNFVNETLTIYCKLFGHETQGGYMFVDTQNITDLHYSFKRVCNSYIWIHSNQILPFIIKMNVREIAYCYDNDISNDFESDVEDSMLSLYLFKSIWKKFDCYCYSIFTDDLEKENEIITLGKKDCLKTDNILQVRDFQYLKGGTENASKKS